MTSVSLVLDSRTKGWKKRKFRTRNGSPETEASYEDSCPMKSEVGDNMFIQRKIQRPGSQGLGNQE